MPIMDKVLSSSVIFLPVILFIGLITTFEDLKEFRIKNKWVIFGLIYSSLIYLFVFILSKSSWFNSYLTWNLDKWCINLIISSLVAYLLWHYKMWGAGDAKLFICYVALIPISQYSKVYFNYYFVSFLLLSAIFIPATAFLIAKSIIYFIGSFDFSHPGTKIRELIAQKLVKFNKIKTLKVLLGFFFFFLFLKVVNEQLYNLFGNRIVSNQNTPILISLLAFRPLARIFNKNIKIIIFALILLIVYIVFRMVYPWQQFLFEIRNTLGKTVLVMLLFPAFSKIVDLYSERVVQKTSPFAIWMFLGVLLVWFL